MSIENAMTPYEQRRLEALAKLNLLDTSPSAALDRITRIAARVFNLPFAAVSLTDSHRQWFKSRVGVKRTHIPRLSAPCALVTESENVLVIEDILQHEHMSSSVLANDGVRFYAGAPLFTREGYCLGAMCVLGTEPRVARNDEIELLTELADMAMSQIELQHSLGRLNSLSGIPNRTQFV
jgi:GAF domain-containing protein